MGPVLAFLTVPMQRLPVSRLASSCEFYIFLLSFLMHHFQHGSAAEKPRAAQEVPVRSLNLSVHVGSTFSLILATL